MLLSNPIPLSIKPTCWIQENKTPDLTRTHFLKISWSIADTASTSKGVIGHFPLTLIAPGRITLPGFVNFPFHPFSLAAFMSSTSLDPPSKIQHENATISWHIMLTKFRFSLTQLWDQYTFKLSNSTSSKRRCTEIYFPPSLALRSLILATKISPNDNIGVENLSAL